MPAFDDVTADLFAEFGRAASYAVPDAAPGAEPQAVTVIVKQPDREGRFGQIEAVQATLMVDVQVADLAKPLKGGVIVLDGSNYTIASAPRRPDANALVWQLDLVASQ